MGLETFSWDSVEYHKKGNRGELFPAHALRLVALRAPALFRPRRWKARVDLNTNPAVGSFCIQQVFHDWQSDANICDEWYWCVMDHDETNYRVMKRKLSAGYQQLSSSIEVPYNGAHQDNPSEIMRRSSSEQHDDPAIHPLEVRSPEGTGGSILVRQDACDVGIASPLIARASSSLDITDSSIRMRNRSQLIQPSLSHDLTALFHPIASPSNEPYPLRSDFVSTRLPFFYINIPLHASPSNRFSCPRST